MGHYVVEVVALDHTQPLSVIFAKFLDQKTFVFRNLHQRAALASSVAQGTECEIRFVEYGFADAVLFSKNREYRILDQINIFSANFHL